MAAILFPVFARARENARRSSCQSNLKQIGLGFAQYTQDYDEKFPIWFNGSYTAPAGGWSFTLQPYLKSVQIFQCPSETTGPDNNPGSAGYSDYAMNLWLGWDGGAPNGKNVSVLTQAALTVMACDSRGSGLGAGNLTWQGSSLNFEDGDPWNGSTFTAHLATMVDATSAQRHLEGQNFLFTDGHVKWCKGASGNTSSAVWSLCTPGSVGGQITPGCSAASPTGPVSGNSPTCNLYP